MLTKQYNLTTHGSDISATPLQRPCRYVAAGALTDLVGMVLRGGPNFYAPAPLGVFGSQARWTWQETRRTTATQDVVIRPGGYKIGKRICRPLRGMFASSTDSARIPPRSRDKPNARHAARRPAAPTPICAQVGLSGERGSAGAAPRAGRRRLGPRGGRTCKSPRTCTGLGGPRAAAWLRDKSPNAPNRTGASAHAQRPVQRMRTQTSPAEETGQTECNTCDSRKPSGMQSFCFCSDAVTCAPPRQRQFCSARR